MYRSSQILLFALSYLAASIQAEPIRLIFDTDMGNDIDDALALAMIHSLETRGACDLLAVTSTKDHPKSVAFIDALNTFYLRPDIPIGAVSNGVTPDIGRYLQLADKTDEKGDLLYPHDLRVNSEAMDAVVLLRKTLASQPDGTVTIVQVGFFTNLANLLQSEPDAHSSLRGRALVAKKVSQLVVMGGDFDNAEHPSSHSEYNVMTDLSSTRLVNTFWPTPILWSGYEIGNAVSYPWESILHDYNYRSPHLIKEGYIAYCAEKDRPTWDLTAVLQAVFPDEGYFDLSPRGNVILTEDGRTRFKANEYGRDRILIMNKLQRARVLTALIELCSQAPEE